MSEFDSKAIVKKYKRCLRSIYCGLLVLAILMQFVVRSDIFFAVSILAVLLLTRIASMILYNKLINTIFTNEMNLPKYADVIKTGEIVSRSLFEHISIAYNSGDYNNAINMCKRQLENKKCAKFAHYYLLILARSYCELGDLENLKAVNDRFNDFVATNKNGEKIKDKLGYFKFVDLYLAGDFAAAKSLYETLYLRQQEKPSRAKLDGVSISFTYAVCCYKCGDFERATALFNNVIMAAPSFHIAEISKRYVESIESNTDYLPEQVRMDTAAATVELPQPKKAPRILYAVSVALILTGVILLLVTAMMGPKQPMHFKGLDYYSTQSDVRALYGAPDETNKVTDRYDVEYIGVKATLNFTYYANSHAPLHSAWLIIDSTQYPGYEDYKAAVEKTYNHFSKTLSKYRIEDNTDESGRYITWFSDKGYSYSMFETELTFSEEENDVRECTVFEFCNY